MGGTGRDRTRDQGGQGISTPGSCFDMGAVTLVVAHSRTHRSLGSPAARDTLGPQWHPRREVVPSG